MFRNSSLALGLLSVALLGGHAIAQSATSVNWTSLTLSSGASLIVDIWGTAGPAPNDNGGSGYSTSNPGYHDINRVSGEMRFESGPTLPTSNKVFVNLQSSLTPFAPVAGNRFRVLTYGSRVQPFMPAGSLPNFIVGNTQGVLAPGLRWTTEFGPLTNGFMDIVVVSDNNRVGLNITGTGTDRGDIVTSGVRPYQSTVASVNPAAVSGFVDITGTLPATPSAVTASNPVVVMLDIENEADLNTLALSLSPTTDSPAFTVVRSGNPFFEQFAARYADASNPNLDWNIGLVFNSFPVGLTASNLKFNWQLSTATIENIVIGVVPEPLAVTTILVLAGRVLLRRRSTILQESGA